MPSISKTCFVIGFLLLLVQIFSNPTFTALCHSWLFAPRFGVNFVYNLSLKKHHRSFQIRICYQLLFVLAVCVGYTITIIHILILTEFGLSFLRRSSLSFCNSFPFSSICVLPNKLVYIRNGSDVRQLFISSHNMSYVFSIGFRSN